MNVLRMAMLGGLLVAGFAVVAPQVANAGVGHVEPVCGSEPVCGAEPVCGIEPVCGVEPVCCPEPVCCTPPPVEVTLCVIDPCTGCPYQVSVCVPACCAAEVPCLAGWDKGIFGRKVLTYKWSCGHCVDVVITKHGRTIVRD